jgi:hypothetical protein
VQIDLHTLVAKMRAAPPAPVTPTRVQEEDTKVKPRPLHGVNVMVSSGGKRLETHEIVRRMGGDMAWEMDMSITHVIVQVRRPTTSIPGLTHVFVTDALVVIPYYGLSDHDTVMVSFSSHSDTVMGKGFWKINNSILKEKDFHVQFTVFWQKLLCGKVGFLGGD